MTEAELPAPPPPPTGAADVPPEGLWAESPGWLALVGGGEWTEGCSFDAELLKASGADEVLVLPTAAAYEHPGRAVETARRWFGLLGATVRGLDVLGRADAEDAANADAVRSARFIYLGGGSPLHLRSVLKDSAVWSALVEAWAGGAVLAGSSAGAMVLGDPMVDPRGGALTLGLGLLPQLAVLPHAGSVSTERAHRTFGLATGRLRIVALDERTALLRRPDGCWSTSGSGSVSVWAEGGPAGLEALAELTPGGPLSRSR
jgi:cyanophycinase